jgi:arylformamidase
MQEESAGNSDFIDLSHFIENGMAYFPGDPEPRIGPAQGVAAPWRVSELILGSHTGTHMDAASHYLPDGKTIDQYPVRRFILPGLVITLAGALAENEPITPGMVAGKLANFPKGGAVIIRTGWDRYWGKDLYFRHPHLTAETARILAVVGVSLVGIDALNVDSTVDESDDVHEILLGNDVLIVENLTHLDQLSTGRLYQFAILPLYLKNLDGSPVRAVAW